MDPAFVHLQYVQILLAEECIASQFDVIRAGGRIGAWFSDVLLYLFGLLAYLFPVMVGWSAVLVFRNLDPLSAADSQALVDYGTRTGLHIYLQPAGPDCERGLYGAPFLCAQLRGESSRFASQSTERMLSMSSSKASLRTR